MKPLVLNYFNRTAIVNSAKEAEDFINSLQYRGNSYSLSCSEYVKNIFERYFNGENVDFYGGVATTGCSTTRIMVYEALASTLEEHNAVYLKQKEEKEKESRLKANKARHEWYKEMYEPMKGWYIVTLDVLVSKIKGNDGVKTYSVRVLANNKMNAYERACEMVMNEGVNDRNVSFVYEVRDSAKSALIEFVGVWDDDKAFEYGELI